jgi:RNA polymerase sigma-32 factor
MSSTALVSHPIPPTRINSLEAYLEKVRKIPLLNAEEERTLAEQVYYKKDLIAAKQLVLSNLRFVAYIAQGYANYGLAMADLVQEGSIGLIKAVKRFNPNLKVRLISFAVHWIKAEIQEFILRNWRIVKVATTKAKRKLFFNWRKNRRLGWANHQEVVQVANELGVKPATVREMEVHLRAQDVSMDYQAQDTDDEAPKLPIVAFSDSRYDPASLLERNNFSDWGQQSLHKALKDLDERSRTIIQERWLTPSKAKLKALAVRYSISIERVRQLEKNAIKMLRNALEGQDLEA